MIISKRLEDAEFIMSKDELTYSAVIEDFKNASQIHILTYNISKDQNVLLKALKDSGTLGILFWKNLCR